MTIQNVLSLLGGLALFLYGMHMMSVGLETAAGDRMKAILEKLTSKAGIAQIDTFFEKYGRNTILICRLLPFVSLDIVSYAAGLTSMSFKSFFIATGIGQLPATIVYSYVGGMLTGGAQLLMTGLLILFALSALIVMLRKIYMDRQKKTKGGNE